MAVSRPIFKLTPSDWSTSRAPLSENQFDNPSKFMVPMLLNFPEDSWVAIDNLTKDSYSFITVLPTQLFTLKHAGLRNDN